MARGRFSFIAAGAGLLLAAAPALAQTWTGAVSGDWDTPGNWNPATVPNSAGAAVIFGASPNTALTFSTVNNTVGSLTFSAGAPVYTFSAAFPNTNLVNVTGAGIINNAATVPQFSINSFPAAPLESTVTFSNAASAGNAAFAVLESGQLDFVNSATAGAAQISASGESDPVVGPSIVTFGNGSNAGSANISVTNLARVVFASTASAANATISVYLNGSASFSGNASAGNAVLSTYLGGTTSFAGNSTAADAAINTYDGGTTTFSGSASGGNATLLIGSGGTVDFSRLTTGGTTASSVANAGTLALGLNRLTLGSGFSQSAGGVLAIQLTPSASGSLVAPSASLAGILQLQPAAGTYAVGTQYPLISGGPISGSFDTITSTAAGLRFGAVQTGEAFDVILLGTAPFANAATTPNQQGVATALDSAPALLSPDLASLLVAAGGLSAAQQPAAFDELGGQAATGAVSLGRAGIRSFLRGLGEQLDGGAAPLAQTASLAQLPVAGAAPLAAWARAFGQFDTLDGDANAAALHASAGGGVLGLERALAPDLTAGIALSYGHADFSLQTVPQQGSLDSVGLGAYAERRWGAVFLDGAALVGYEHGEETRSIDFGGLSQRASGGFDGWTLGGRVGAGARFHPTPLLTLEPSVALDATHLAQDAITESGAGAADLAIAAHQDAALQTTLGARLAQRIDIDAGIVEPELRIAWAHELGDVVPRLREQFQDIPAAGFTIAGAATPRDVALFGFGLGYRPRPGLALYARYNGAFGQRETDHGVVAGVKLTW